MAQYPKDRYSNLMALPVTSDGSRIAIYHYVKPTVQNCKVTFVDGSVYWEKAIFSDKTLWISSEKDTLYLDEDCTVLAEVTRKDKIEECKRMWLIK